MEKDFTALDVINKDGALDLQELKQASVTSSPKGYFGSRRGDVGGGGKKRGGVGAARQGDALAFLPPSSPPSRNPTSSNSAPLENCPIACKLPTPPPPASPSRYRLPRVAAAHDYFCDVSGT